ncbi:sensor histidine kinase [Donghicola mangrovi]|uniref:histidine kinase n=1 Tax=Donghicola mangrovi TaxID=2729614 RepID=A0A850Q7X4_9RHOB|nr:HAMP domain-containing sensor histidine kinase [Donghicola mangrovi]NVO22850.1 HAMP domain-containing histidine kinase [Donghicola mangrovi]
MNALRSLQGKTVSWILWGTLAGLVTGAVWANTQNAWERHLDRADYTGRQIYGALVNGAPMPSDVTATQIDAPPQGRGRVTEASILTGETEDWGGARLLVQVHDPQLAYTLNDLPPSSTPPERLGAMTRKMARLCGNPTLYARPDGRSWIKVTAPSVWSCESAPNDMRLPLGLAFILALVSLLTRSSEVTGRLGRLARIFSSSQGGGTTMLPLEGPSELNEIADALNTSITREREALEKRAEALSAISHDLGTPAARLKLRTALIDDPTLRTKMEGDIDQMIAMVEGVLSFTRTELDAEPAQQISLTALVETIVDDYEDLGRRVSLGGVVTGQTETQHSLFGVTPGVGVLNEHPIVLREAQRVLVMARPLALQRAITNLVENALNYGRRATLRIESHAAEVSVLVEDAGGGAVSAAEMADLIAPFRRGANAGRAAGNGLGLSIVQTVARQHNGSLSFEEGPEGLVARLTLRRE